MKALQKVIIGYARYISTLPVESKLPEQALAELIALREAGEKMAESLRNNRRVVDLGNPNDQWAFISEDAAALEAWEAANK